jgi:type IV pilus biogenesis protein CpaD/CtpE
VTRDSDTQVTITLPAVAGYNIASDQTITLNIPSGSISGVSSTVTASPVFTIKAAAAVALSGTALSATEAEIAAGGKTIVLTLTNGTFATKIASDPLKRDALFDGLTAGSDTAEWAEVIAALKAAGTSAVARNSDTQVTITLPAVAGYDISGDQTITLSIPSGSISGVSSTVTATPTVTITATLV